MKKKNKRKRETKASKALAEYSKIKKYGDREINLRFTTTCFEDSSVEDAMWVFGKVIKTIEDYPMWTDDKIEEFFEGADIKELEQFDTAWEDFISRKREHENTNKKRIPGEPDRNRYYTGPDEYDPNG